MTRCWVPQLGVGTFFFLSGNFREHHLLTHAYKVPSCHSSFILSPECTCCNYIFNYGDDGSLFTNNDGSDPPACLPSSVQHPPDQLSPSVEAEKDAQEAALS